MIFEAIKLYYSLKYPFKVQAESDYTCVDLNNEAQFEDFHSKTNLLSKSNTNRIWSFSMTFIIIIFKNGHQYWICWLHDLSTKKKVYVYTKKIVNAMKVLIKHDDILA